MRVAGRAEGDAQRTCARSAAAKLAGGCRSPSLARSPFSQLPLARNSPATSLPRLYGKVRCSGSDLAPHRQEPTAAADHRMSARGERSRWLELSRPTWPCRLRDVDASLVAIEALRFVPSRHADELALRPFELDG